MAKSRTKKLRRSKDRILLGVCGGIAEYFSVDPTLVRVIWAVGTVLTFFVGVDAYIVAAIIIPEK